MTVSVDGVTVSIDGVTYYGCTHFCVELNYFIVGCFTPAMLDVIVCVLCCLFYTVALPCSFCSNTCSCQSNG